MLRGLQNARKSLTYKGIAEWLAITLTTGIDTVNGTASNDKIIGDNTTLGASDNIKGGAGTDTLDYSDSSTTGVTPQGLVSEVEVINIRNVTGSAATAAVKEVVTLSFTDYTHGTTNSTITFGNTGAPSTLTLSANTTGVNIASQVAAMTFTNYDVTGISGNTVTLTAKTAGTATDVTASMTLGTGGSGGSPAAVVATQGAAAVASAAAALTVNASNFSGATDFNSNLSTGSVSFTNLAAGQKVGLIGNGAAVLGNVNAAYGTGVTATVVNVSGGVGPTGTTAPSVTLSGPTVPNTSTINSTGSAANTLGGVALGGNTTGLTVDAAARLSTGNITGFTGTTASITVKGAAAGTATAAAVNLGTIENTTVKTIDASGLTAGGIAAVLNTNQTIAVTGGQGQDIITAGSILTTGSVDAGAGTTDRLIITASNQIDATTGKLYKNFEQLQVNDGVSVDVTQLATTNTIDAIRINGANSSTGVTNLNATQAGNVTIVAANATGAITIGVKDATSAGQIDTVKANLINTNATGTAGVAVDLTGLTLAGVEKLELTSTGATSATAGAVTLTTTNAIALDSIKLASAANSNAVTVANTHVGTNLVIDASASTGSTTLNAVDYTAGTTGAQLLGGSSFDVLLGATARADKLVGNAGNDVIVNSAYSGTITAGTATAIGSVSGGAITDASAADILTGGAGRDMFVLGANSAVATISSITDLDLGGATAALGVDGITLDMTTAGSTTAPTIATLSDTVKTNITNALTLAAALDVVAAATDAAANTVAQFTYGTDTYLFVNNAGSTATYQAGDDVVIKITGVTGTLDASDITII